MAETLWRHSWRTDPASRVIADRHYNRQSHGAANFVPPGRCLVLRAETETGRALWVTSYPFAEYVRHAWAGALVCSAFRNEGAGRSSDLIRDAVAITRWRWPPPELGMITFVDPTKVPGVRVRGQKVYGYCFLKAGFRHVGFTKENNLWAWQILPDEMPEPMRPYSDQMELVV
jgi:hypothetical protein